MRERPTFIRGGGSRNAFEEQVGSLCGALYLAYFEFPPIDSDFVGEARLAQLAVVDLPLHGGRAVGVLYVLLVIKPSRDYTQAPTRF